jgi:molybdopterin synthase catalytic subunit
MDEFTRGLPAGEGGAIVSFTGIVREDRLVDGNDSRMTTGVEIECIPDLAAASLRRITAAIEQRPGIVKAIIIHFSGSFSIGEPLVHVIVCAQHREEGFKALEDAVNQYKQETPIWKKECYSDGSSAWIYH